MLNPLHFRVTGFATLIVATVALIGWSAHASWSRFGELRDGLEQVQLFEERIIGLHVELNHLTLTMDPENLQLLAQKSRELAAWLEGEKRDPSTERERALLERVSAAYAGYLAGMENLAAQAPGPGPDRLARTVALEEQLVRVLRESLARFLDETQRGLAPRQTLIFVLLGWLLLMSGWLAIVVYRDMIKPLRARLIEAGAAVEQSQKLASLGVLAAGIAHEIRNPLTAIKARLFTHQKTLAADSPGRVDAEFIGREINRLERIVRDFLLFARPAEPELAAISSMELLRGVRDLLAPELLQASIELRLEEGPALPVHVDQQHIEQVLINLVRNSAESIGERGRIVLRSRAARASLRGTPHDVVVLEVEDSGKGIPADIQAKLFDPFFTTKPNGTGLGLAIAARIVEKHGGALRFQSRMHHGTTFGLVLPRANKP